jgi:hypothetical protein
MESTEIAIVSGLPRSGTSMMMKMLEAGGMPVLTDHVRTADEDNPKGYYEFERVKQIEHDKLWLEDAQGKVVKMIGALLKHLPPDYAYKVIFMKRDINQVLASQRQMLLRRGEPAGGIPDEKMAELFLRHVTQIEAWLADRPNFDVIYMEHGEVLSDPDGQARRVASFLGGGLDTGKMAQVVDPALHRQRQ